MLTKHFDEFELKVEGDGRTVTGYGSIYGNADLGGDIVQKGAFTQSIAKKMPKMLFQHKRDEVIGVWESVQDDERGLLLTGKLADTPRGNEVKELIRIGAISGLSIGYKTIDSEFRGKNLVLKTLDLAEVSVVTFPMNERANIISLKAAQEMTIREMEQLLRDAGLSQKTAQTILSGGYAALQPETEEKADDELIAMLKARLSYK